MAVPSTIPSTPGGPQPPSEELRPRPWDTWPAWARPTIIAIVGIAVLAFCRIFADAPDLTAGDTFAAAVGAAAPIGLAALGGLFSERAGVVNIGLEGMMILGTWGAGWSGWHYGPYAALVGGFFFGALGGLLHAVATVTFGVDQVVSGFAINILAPGITRFLSSELFAGEGDGAITKSPTMTGTMGQFTMPFLSGGSLFGWTTPDPLGWLDDKRWFFISDVAGLLHGLTAGVAYSTLLAIVMFPISWYVLWRTAFGLRVRSIGEKPSAADSLGVAVYKLKYIAVVISGGLAGLGGAWLAIDVRSYNQDQTAGRGFQALAALIFGNWKPAGIAAGTGLFAFSQALTQRIGTAPVRALFLVATVVFGLLALRQFLRRHPMSGTGIAVLSVLAYWYYMATETVNNQIVYVTPYVVTLLVLAFSSQHLRPPAAAGRPYRKGSE